MRRGGLSRTEVPGKLLTPQSVSREAGKTMGVYKLTFPESSAAGTESRLGSKTTGSRFRNPFTRRRYHNVENSNLAQQSHATVSSSLEAPEMEHFKVISEDDVLLQSSDSESRFTGARTSNVMTTDDDLMLMELSRRGRTSHDDSSFMDFASRDSMSQDVDFAAQQPARHSTACCSDLAFRRELRKRFHHVKPTVVKNGMRRVSTSSYTMSNSFRRELEKPEDRVESLALWEETRHGRLQPASARISSNSNVVAASNATPHSWHAGETAASSRTSARNKSLDAILRKKKSSFFSGFFSGLSFSSFRKSRKSLG